MLRAQDWLSLSFPSRAASTHSGHHCTAMIYYKQQHLLGNAESNQAEKPERFYCYTRSIGLSLNPHSSPKSISCCLWTVLLFICKLEKILHPKELCHLLAALLQKPLWDHSKPYIPQHTNRNLLISLGCRQFMFWMHHLYVGWHTVKL